MYEKTMSVKRGDVYKKETVFVYEDVDKIELNKRFLMHIYACDMDKNYFKSRVPNIPEVISEGVFCLATGCVRLKSGFSGDCYDPVREKIIQVKACSFEEDLTSFSPSNHFDEIVFLDFCKEAGEFRKGNVDFYRIPKDFLLNVKVNKKETFADQQAQGRRPRLSIKNKIIKVLNLLPFMNGHLNGGYGKKTLVNFKKLSQKSHKSQKRLNSYSVCQNKHKCKNIN